MKVLDAAHASNREAIRRFEREANLAARVRHRNVIDVYELGVGGAEPLYIAQELLVGESLGDLLAREGPLPPGRAASLLVPVMRAMAYVHRQGVVHRDLKPDNLFIHRDPEGGAVPKVLDFGIARVAAENPLVPRITIEGAVIGTPSYMAPEQALGAESAGPGADVWSMGIVWYEALTGATPFEGATPLLTLLAVCRAEYAPVERRCLSLPVALAAEINRALERDPARRHRDMGALLEALLAATDGVEDDAHDDGSVESHAPPTRPSLLGLETC